jgi:HAD superfamily hydrolase (TIGR01509 family)
MPPSAVLFDFDGVIADSENHHIAAWQRTLMALGWEIPDDEAALSAEMDDREFLRGLFDQRGVEVGDIEGWVRKKQQLTIALLRDSPRIYPGVIELVQSLRGRVRLAVVSGTWRENVEAVLANPAITGAFEFIVGKEDVGSVKPDPEAYLLALRKLAMRPAEVVAIEDSPSGIAAARAAGIAGIAVGHRRGFGEWVGDSVYFTGLDPVSGLMRHLELNEAGE